MGNAGIIYDRTTVNFGASGVQGAQSFRNFSGERVFAGTAQITLTNLLDALEIQKAWGLNTDPNRDLFFALETFWNGWAAAGKPFAFALDVSKILNAKLDSDLGSGNLFDNGDVEVWAPGVSAPDGWTITLVGSTTITRETREGEVAEGLFSLKWTVVGGAQSTAKLTTARPLAAFEEYTLSLLFKGGSGLGRIEYAIRDVTANTYLQSDGSTWSASAFFFTPAAPTSQEYAVISKVFNGNSDGNYEVTLRNATGAAFIWADDVRMIHTQSTATLRNLGGVAIGDGVRFISRAGMYEEDVRVSSVTPSSAGAGQIAFTPLLLRRYVTGDFVRHSDFWPALVADQEDCPITEHGEGYPFQFKLKCREALSGRAA